MTEYSESNRDESNWDESNRTGETASSVADTEVRRGPSGEDAFRSAAAAGDAGLVREFWDFLRENKKWWLTPIIVVVGLLTLVAVLSVSPAAPFIYTLF